MIGISGVGQTRVQKLWAGAVPPREKLSVQVSGTCVTFMDNWQMRIFGPSIDRCFTALFSMQGTLKELLDKHVTSELMSPGGGYRSIDAEIRNQRLLSFASKIAWMLAGVAIGAAVGVLK